MVNQTRSQATVVVPNDFIQLTISNYKESLPEVVDLYEKGLSLRDIAARTSISKSKVRHLLLSSGISLRETNKGCRRISSTTKSKLCSKPPYGFCFHEGRIVVHPKEYPHLLAIIARWKKGQALNSIAKWLNGKRVPSPMGKLWSFNSIDNIIKRIKNGHLVQKGEHYELR